MQKPAEVRRQGSNRDVRNAAVNAAHVCYVYSDPDGGSYIAFEDKATVTRKKKTAKVVPDKHHPDSNGVTPIGIKSPDSVEVVIRRLNRPYWIDLAFRVGGLVVTVLAVIFAIIQPGVYLTLAIVACLIVFALAIICYHSNAA